MTSEPRQWNRRADELAAEHLADGTPTGWFERLYAEGVAGDVTMPWDHVDPHVLLREWAERTGARGLGRRAVVVGCGLGADAAYLAELGFETTGFDLSPTAIEVARERFGDRTFHGSVDFRAADLLDLPPEWIGAFDLVVEIFTLQAVPDPPRSDLVPAVGSLVAPGGTLLAIQFRHTSDADDTEGPPFALGETRMRSLAADSLELVALEEIDGPLWRLECRRPRLREGSALT